MTRRVVIPAPGADRVIPAPGADRVIPAPGADRVIPAPGADRVIPAPGADRVPFWPTFGPDDLILDYFAGGGGASEGIRQALDRGPDVAINHCPLAIAMHAANHPITTHLTENVWNVDPVRDLPPGDVRLVWVSPSCTHFSRARGGRPVSKQLRALPWVAIRVAAKRRPAVIVLENVAEFRKWGPVSRDGQPVKAREGATFRRFVRELEALGYIVEHRVLCAADYGAPTLRKRLFLLARCDGQPIVWPEPTHGPGRATPYRSAAECVDWSLPMLSIFQRKSKKPLAKPTLRRIAEGLRRFLFESVEPFIVQANHGRDVNRSRSIWAPMPTITAKHGFGLVAPTLIQTSYGERKGQAPRVLDLHKPLGTVVAGGQKHTLVAASLTKFYGTSTGQSLFEPAPTITAQGQHIALVNATLDAPGTPAPGADCATPDRRFQVAELLLRLYDEPQAQARAGQGLKDILDETRRTGVITIRFGGERYVVSDIGLRMLSPRELARAQGFGDDYQLTGTLEQQVARVGNSVPPPLAAAIVAANVAPLSGTPRAPRARRAA